MAHFVKNEQCPKCAQIGKDKHNDNLGVFSDGSCFCWSCGYFKSASGIEKLKDQMSRGETTTHQPTYLPRDVDFNLPRQARDRLHAASLTNADLDRHRVMWSEQYQRIIFPYFIEEEVVAWQGRYIGNDNKAKWYSQGPLNTLLYVCNNNDNDPTRLVWVEDIISAIRVGHVVNAAPLFGSSFPTARIPQLGKYKTLDFWLDYDKLVESTQFSKRMRDFGKQSKSIITEKDPKEYTREEIQKAIDK